LARISLFRPPGNYVGNFPLSLLDSAHHSRDACGGV